MIDSPIPIPPEAGLEVGRQRPISHQDGLQVDWEAQRKYEAALVQRHIVAELEGNRQFLREYQRIMGLSVLWFWVVVLLMVALIAAGIGGGIAGGMNVKKNKEHDQKHGDGRSNADKTNITSPCQDNPYINNTIVSVDPGGDVEISKFRIFCNRTFDLDSSIHLMKFAVPDTVANMSSCMATCLDYNMGGAVQASSNGSTDICYAVSLGKDKTSEQQWCKLLSATGWGTDEVGADCAVNLGPAITPTSNTKESIRTTSATSQEISLDTQSISSAVEWIVTKDGTTQTWVINSQSIVSFYTATWILTNNGIATASVASFTPSYILQTAN
ncbi:hypothetical protein EYC80_010173 [Monilinia laxa]|uniref:Uncharacterized protein n=1 Tax=Monilinia laxa TaxID=61186 RepID=A0A5N6JM20_MONLA|nr:hypothetical protein EYC80_010173 [Monilinia laxa]